MKIMRLFTLPAVALALALSAAPAATASTTAATTTTTTTVHIVSEDGGTTVHAGVGDTVQVDLTALRDYTVTWFWYAPAAASAAVLTQTAGTADPNGNSHATFTASTAGTSDINAIGRCVPDPRTVCPPFVARWKVAVVVS
ncbi:hypothetical protein [Kitasatospora purpeofusca]|uniref:hypothetical protein n=1 Tax=Kitasatospora purpeofusca TaxID=67352 RepID=UPI00224E63BE|nr:hypothetical protein [Kitasatospora purpeofusca]MCX4756992.1 hypothetical protein [Kitasatospora purpeofusca]WSR35240.1 hypothetical protein OG715_32350 [Kitasatospora purpeofusca]WSR43560.1 hypothetical protein OG196_33390 [Kitasatospora purpeofusca]